MKYAIGIWLTLAALVHAGTLDFKELSKEINAAADATSTTAEFEFTNKTSRAITIKKCDPGCSCVAVQISDGKLRYEPGESGVISAKFDMTNFSGTVDKVIALFLDDDPADKPSQVLKLKINIPVLVALEPKTLKWNLGANANPQTIHIKIIEGQTIRVTNVKSSSEAFTLKLNTLEEGKLYDLVVTPNAMEAPGIGVFRVETDCKIQKHRIQQAFGVVRKPTPAETATKP
ncbi:MAG: DUF1573 domain-containing protein [Luteolibacter sp.]